MKKIIIKITQEPQSPPYGDYDILYAYGIDKEKNIYELVFTDVNGKAGKLESVKNCYTAIHIDPALVILKGKEGKQNGETKN